jgi:Integrase zinc binding domain
LDRPHDEVGSRVGSRQREQSAWQDGQPVCTAVHQPARLRYGGFSIEKGYSTGAAERCRCVRALPARHFDGSARSTAAAKVDAGGMRMMNNALWIPERAVELQLRLCVESHCRSAGNRAYEATLGAIKEYVAWTTMAKDVKVFVPNCLHCVATIPGDKVPLPLGT